MRQQGPPLALRTVPRLARPPSVPLGPRGPLAAVWR
jgi:hypothetical protein